MGLFIGVIMKQLIEQLIRLSYVVSYEYNPVEQLIYYQVWCGDILIDMGLADEITFEGELSRVVKECIECKIEC